MILVRAFWNCIACFPALSYITSSPSHTPIFRLIPLQSFFRSLQSFKRNTHSSFISAIYVNLSAANAPMRESTIIFVSYPSRQPLRVCVTHTYRNNGFSQKLQYSVLNKWIRDRGIRFSCHKPTDFLSSQSSRATHPQTSALFGAMQVDPGINDLFL